MNKLSSLLNNTLKDIKSCNPLLLYTVLSISVLIYNICNGLIAPTHNYIIDVIVTFTTGFVVSKLCKDRQHKMAYGVVGLYAVYWIIGGSSTDTENPDVLMANASNAMNMNMNGNGGIKEQFQQCQLITDESGVTKCQSDYNLDARNGVGALSGVGNTCGKSGYCNVGEYYEKRGDWIQQQDLSMPDGPPRVAENCLSSSPTFDRPCSAFETPATKLRNYPIDTDHHQPHYRLCHEDPMKVQIAHDPESFPYVATKNV